MLRQNLGRAIALAALAGISASTLALSAGPERPRAQSGTGIDPVPTTQADCRNVRPTRIEPARLALLARCMTGSDGMARRPPRAATKHDCAQGPRAAVARHAVCYAAILPEPDETGAAD